MKRLSTRNFFLVLMGWMLSCGLFAQHVLYPTCFDLSEVTLLDSPFKRAQDLNYHTLLEYDTDRLLTPFVRQSGLSRTKDEKSPYYQWEYEHPAFESFAWNPALAMDGHVLGHYLSALSLAYSTCKERKLKQEFRQRIENIVKVLCDCQSVFDVDKTGMKGFIGGIPDNTVWTSLLEADYRVYNQRGNWVPFYCEHKVMAGLRDAYIYADNQMAKEAYRKMCDWVIQVVSMFNEDIMEMQILQWETGGMNEVLADAYDIFGDSKYMKAANKFSHQIVVENMNVDRDHTFLDKRHTNELAAMFLGVSRICRLKRDNRYYRSVRGFWEDVVESRSSAIGGIGVGGCFLPKGKGMNILNDADGPDLCTTANMIKISESLFAAEPQAKYADYVETALLNHVLSDIDPETGGFGFYTPLRPGAYRVYSKVNAAMWCCAGTGMESQSRYGEFIYSMVYDTLFVNLFIPSELNSGKVAVRQESCFPYGDCSTITIRKTGNYQLAIRHPNWATSGFQIRVNGKPLKYKASLATPGVSSYICCGKGWKAGDVIEVDYPMTLTFVPCRDNEDYIALRYGPSVLAAQTSSREVGTPYYEALQREFGGAGVHDFSPQSIEKIPNLAFAPMLICELADVPNRVKMVNKDKLEFEMDATAPGSLWKTVSLRPFYDLHHTRYSVYLNRQTESAWIRNPLFKDQLRKYQLEAVTFDEITLGDASSEESHQLEISETGSRGSLNGKTFRDAQPDQWFEFSFHSAHAAETSARGEDVALVCMFAVMDKGRTCDLIIDGQVLDTYTVQIDRTNSGGKDKFFERVFKVSNDILKDKAKIVVRFSSSGGSYVPRVFQVRLMKYEAGLLN